VQAERAVSEHALTVDESGNQQPHPRSDPSKAGVRERKRKGRTNGKPEGRARAEVVGPTYTHLRRSVKVRLLLLWIQQLL
jgi:hypothetical protein